jgi:phosphate starvation-inducible protein PhoH
MVITGDVTQVDLPDGRASGCASALDPARHPRITFIILGPKTWCGNGIVASIVEAYRVHEEGKAK